MFATSVARLGLFINLSASLGDIGFIGQWTLQLYAINRIKIYPRMAIGQMMWWQPAGTIQLYAGKYQGSRGPRASAIHIDHRPKTAVDLPGLDDQVEREQVVGKFAALVRLHADFPIPDAFAIPTAEFVTALGPRRLERLRATFADLHATVGAHALDACAQIDHAVADVCVPDDLATRLVSRLAELNPDGHASFAVRSSGLGEDGTHDSYAGVHESQLHVVGTDNIIDAVTACWRSYYSAPAVLARIRAGDTSPAPRFAVVVQRMITPVLAGVAFTRSAHRVDVEHVTGTGDELMAGVAVPARTVVDHHTDAVPVRIAHVAELAQRAREALGTDADIEWAIDADETLWLLQCRPVTAPLDPAPRSPLPALRTAALYPNPTDECETDDIYYGAVTQIVASSRRKRGTAFALARELGARTLPGWVVNLNGHGLDDAAMLGALDRLLRSGPTGTVVLDLGEGLRQQVITKPDLVPHLRRLLYAGTPTDDVRAFVLREYLRGDHGVIATLQDGDLLLEISADGLLPMNRGTATTDHLIIKKGSKPGESTSPVSAAHRATIERVCAALDDRYGAVTTEWVLDAGQLYFVDYSPTTATSGGVPPDLRVLSPGRCSGPILTLQIQDEQLARVSLGAAISVNDSTGQGHQWAADLIRQADTCDEPPIVVARRPYAALSVLIGHVAGFVFEDGSLLCHLGILLREAGIPAVLDPHPPSRGHGTINELGLTIEER